MSKTESLIMLGDSITNGFDGHHDLEKNVSYYLKQLNPALQITNAGVNAGTIVGRSERDLTFQVDTHDFRNYQLATIFYGTNDFAHRAETLEILGSILQTNLTHIKQENPQIKIFGILPINRFDGSMDNYSVSGLAQYSFAELLNKLTEVYHANQIPVLNWRKIAPNLLTINNYAEKLGDQRLHPNSQTYAEMATVLNQFLKENAANSAN
ncbi:SGNH/GDSL hydrolase family protein [Fructilactobacillus frigidiflavus]|uniref:SGNH/GDSL hydrolase family protein n=1 Tax=Fructilactobacillus frigidiflavus TaxID=3242688 RepID=UPI003757CC15